MLNSGVWIFTIFYSNIINLKHNFLPSLFKNATGTIENASGCITCTAKLISSLIFTAVAQTNIHATTI
jgi:hypothetical protein